MANYKLIKKAPCSEDLFEGKSHTAIAKQICSAIHSDDNCKMIGIDGDWGSGKSNLLELVKQNINKEKKEYYFFIYDAWGHQEDIQRRAILENLTDFVLKEEIIRNVDIWKGKNKTLISKTRETEIKTIPKLSVGVIIGLITIILVPAITSATQMLEQKCWSLFVQFLPFIISLLIFMYFLTCKRMTLKCALQEFLSFYNKDRKDELTTEVISESQPSSSQFRQWIRDLSGDLVESTNCITKYKTSKKLVLVFDNMDRLPAKKVQELWSSIHAFFSEETYRNIWVIIPFDRKHIITAFKNEDIDEICYGDDFINKTFDVVYRVSPPTLSDWKQYFREQWSKVFGYSIDEKNYQNITQIYDLLEKNFSPRKIIAFINELTTIKQISPDVPDPYIALYIFGKNEINKNGLKEFFAPSFLGAIDFLYKSDTELPKYLAAIHYQLPIDKVQGIIFTEKLKKALDNKDIETAINISQYGSFADVLESCLAGVSNIPNAVEVLGKIFENSKHDEFVKHSWKTIFRRLGDVTESTLKEYQIILLKNIENPNVYLTKILKELIKDFKPKQYFSDIQKLLSVDRIEVFANLQPIEVEVKQFIEFAKLAQKDIGRYEISCEQSELDNYLSNLNAEQLKDVDYIPYLKDSYPLNDYNNRIKGLIPENNTNIPAITILFTRLKELERPISFDGLTDGDISTLFGGISLNDQFYSDLLCMRIARADKFSSNYTSDFDNRLDEADDDLLQQIAERIEYYICYGDLLLNLDKMNYDWYKKIVSKLTVERFGGSRADILSLLQKYNMIRDNLTDYLDKQTLIDRLNKLSTNAKENIDIKNINTVSIDFFEDIKTVKNELASHCIDLSKNYLTDRTKEEWISDIKEQKFAYKIINYIDLPMLQNTFEALKEVIKEFLDNGDNYKSQIEMLLSKAQKDERDLITMFKDIRDKFIRGDVEMDTNIFGVLGEYLLKYGNLTENNEVLRTILTNDVVDMFSDTLIKYSDEVKKIMPKDDARKDFENHIIEKAKTDSNIKSLATKLDITIPTEPEND